MKSARRTAWHQSAAESYLVQTVAIGIVWTWAGHHCRGATPTSLFFVQGDAGFRGSNQGIAYVERPCGE